jgi:hypothetical protein
MNCRRNGPPDNGVERIDRCVRSSATEKGLATGILPSVRGIAGKGRDKAVIRIYMRQCCRRISS